jgi:ATP-dependent helicase/DNAse subunit B
MTLTLIHGPPNSGRAGLIRRIFTEQVARGPVLVVPNIDDAFAFERELCRTEGALVGGAVLTFGGLFAEVARASGEPPPPGLTPAQRLRLVRAAIDGKRGELGPLRSSAARPGFAPALDRLVEQLQAAGLAPEAVESGAATLEGSAYLGDLATLFRAYLELRQSHGHTDSHAIARAAITALRKDPDAWRGRPVLLYGFDDLTGEQLELVDALRKAAEVTVAVTYEDRSALAARARLLALLGELGADSEIVSEPDPDNTESALLFHLERSFLTGGGQRVAPDGSLVLLRSAGARGEAEAVGAEIARLLHDGAPAEGIAVALRDPARRGTLFARILADFGIPVALEADLPVAATATGGCLLSLLRAAFGTRTAGDLLAYLRGPRRAGLGKVDRLERSIRRRRLRSAEEAAAAWEEIEGRPLEELDRLRDAARRPQRLLGPVAELARDIAQWPLAREQTRGRSAEPAAALELRAGDRIAAVLEELAALDELAPEPEELLATLEALTMRPWSGPTQGRVRIASPYRLRAGRVQHLFVASLQDGEFPRRSGDGPLLSDEQAAALGLPRVETELEERYLFYACLSLPTRSLYLSYRASDEAGGAEARSPFVDEVRRLLAPEQPGDGSPDPVEAAISRGRGLGNVVFPPADAPSEDELARALAPLGAGQAEEALSRLQVAADSAERIRARLARARVAEKVTREPGPLRLEAVIGALGEVGVYGGTTIEGFDLCSYRWFVDHELRPEALEPVPEPLAQGSLMHAALESLYRERPGGDALPRPSSLEAWLARGRELVRELAAAQGLSEHPADRAMRRRVATLLEAFLRREARRESPAVEPLLLEAAFDDRADAERPALRVADWGLHGQIDRVDLGPDGGLVVDYKLARDVTPVARFKRDAKLQLPLYALALRELWGIDPIGAIYQPLRPTTDPSPRGFVRKDALDELADLGLVASKDALEPEAFELVLEQARARAIAAVGRMRKGAIARDPGPAEGPGRNQCPSYCGFAPICRRERAMLPLTQEEAEEENGGP